MTDDLISVVIPVYNSSQYLEECLDSVIKQTYRHLEIIAVNDGSTDTSLNILQNYASQFKFIKVINQNNSGQSVARNKGINLAKGKYIYFLDSDDYIVPNAFKDLINHMEHYSVDLIRFSADVFLDGVSKKVKKDMYYFDRVFKKNVVYNKKSFLTLTSKAYSASPVLYLMKKQLLIDNHIRFKPRIIHEDDLFTVEVFLNVDNSIYLPESLYKRRVRPYSTMTSKTIEDRKFSFSSRRIILEKLIDLSKRYIKKEEQLLIKSRSKKLTKILSRNYSDLDERFKIREIKKIPNINLKVKYCFLKIQYKLFAFVKLFVKNNK